MKLQDYPRLDGPVCEKMKMGRALTGPESGLADLIMAVSVYSFVMNIKI